MRQKLKEELLLLYPHISENLGERYVGKYVKAVMAEIAKRFMFRNSDELNDGEMDFSFDAVSNVCGRYKIHRNTGYILQLMQKNLSTSLIIRQYKGNSITHRVSRVILNPIYKKGIMEELGSLIIECKPERLSELQSLANHSVEIDRDSLNSYIEQTKLALEWNKGQAYDEKLLRNLQIANQLLSLVREENGLLFLDEYWDEIDSGRMHGHGLSLQRVPKEVRHAALGLCYRYDFKAASYALMTSFALLINPTLKTASLQDYIKNRSHVRKRIAKDIGISEEWMKGIFTAIGFGAQLKDNPYNSIRAKLGQEKYQKLLCNTEFMYIKNQLDQVSETILNDLGTDDFEFLGKPYTTINPKDGSKRTKNQKLAWLYQRMESDVLALFLELIPKNYKIKLLVHDCVYLDKSLSFHHMADIKYQLKQRYSLIDFAGDEIIPIHSADFISKLDKELALFEREHRECIAIQTKIAEIKYDNYCDFMFIF